jgi:hypothetical protein
MWLLHMSQTIKPVKWLESALWLLVMWDIFETTRSVVVNDEGSELWTCSLAFDIPIRYNNEVHQDIMQTGWQMSTKTGAQIDAVLLSLQAIEWIGYRMPDLSSLKIEALREHSLDVPWVSERYATFNQMDVVCHRVWYEGNVYLFLLLYECFLIFLFVHL